MLFARQILGFQKSSWFDFNCIDLFPTDLFASTESSDCSCNRGHVIDHWSLATSPHTYVRTVSCICIDGQVGEPPLRN